MVATVGSIQTYLKADMVGYVSGLNRAADATGRFDRRVGSYVGRTERTLVGLRTQALATTAALAKIFMAGLAGGVLAGGVTGIVASLRGVASSVAAIGDEARRAGVTTRVFQEWKAVAVQARIPVDAMVDAFKELNIRADEFAVTGKGSAAEAFARLGLTPVEVKERLKDPSDLMLLLIERTRKLNDTAAATRIFDELFGGTGAERLVTLLDQSNDSIRGTIDQAHRLSNVLSDDVIARAAEIDRHFNIITQTVGTALKGAIVEAATSLQQFIDSFRAFENQQGASLGAELATIGRQRLDLENKILKLRNEQRGAFAGNPFGRDYESDIAFLEAEREALGETEAQILAVIEARRLAAAVPVTPASPGWTPPAYKPPPPAGGGRDKGAAAAEREAEAVRRLIAELQRELALVGATEVERDKSNALRQAGAAATDEQRREIEMLIEALHREKAAVDAVQKASEFMSDTIGGAVMDLVPQIDSGNAALDRFLNTLLEAVAMAMLLGKGPLAGLFGGGFLKIFGLRDGGIAGRDGEERHIRLADGGKVRGPGGPRGDKIPAMLSAGEYVVNARSAAKYGSLLAALNADRVQGFADGGAVSEYASKIWGRDLTSVDVTAGHLAAAGRSLKHGGEMRHRVEVVGTFVDDGGIVKGIARGEATKAAGALAKRVPSMAVGAVEDGKFRRLRPQGAMG